MKKKELLHHLTGTEEPKFITDRESEIIDKCLVLINDRIPLSKSSLKNALFAAYLTGRDNGRNCNNRGRSFNDWYPDNVDKELQVEHPQPNP